MKLGVSGMLPGDWRMIDGNATRRVRDAGFLGAQLFINKPLEADPRDIERVKSAFHESDLEICQANGWYEALVNPDDEIRAEGVRGLQALTRIGRMVNAPTTYVRPGGVNPRGHWYAHPDNHSVQTFDRLVDSLKKVGRVAQAEGMILAIEGHVLSPLDSPQRIRDVLDAVASPALKFNTDPVNFIGTVKDVHDTRQILNQLFDMVGPDTVAGHAKDVTILDALVVHIEEVLIGNGTLDYSLFLTRFQEFNPDGYLMVEHLPDEKVPLARKALVEKAQAIGIPLIF
jgi:sugar phosphate isomerase/epimerase